MSFTRNQYDKCAYTQNIEQSVHVGNYQFFEYQGKHPNPCRVDFGVVGGNNVSVSQSQVDIESNLRGQTNKLSLCSNNKHLPPFLQKEEKKIKPLPTCKIIQYKPVIYAKPTKASICTMYK